MRREEGGAQGAGEGEGEERGRRRGGWALCPPNMDFQPPSPSTSKKKSTSPRHLLAMEIAPSVVSGGPPRPITATDLASLLVVWYGPKKLKRA